ncbi:hypothetical protein QTN47_11625 [Danxiaibacter flavus]|uniref:Uncharacterized protein n=1 Tax=Danxiaibacter flavus TaxID=3049108 RepID=A0ABV3ZF41_9BACT|nr:hypothetical protein QNM32_11630 [Chitinophagaceae bacterium DXS]
MFNSPILDLVIALSFTYFLLGLIVSTIHEFIYSVVMQKEPKRARFLKQSIECLFLDGDWKKFVQEKLMTSVHIDVLRKNNSPQSFPSYIPNSNFALAIIDQFRTNSNLLDVTQIQNILTNDELAAKYGITGELRRTLLSLVERSNGQLMQFQANLESYFNTAMDRLAGSYIRSTKKAIFVIALVLTVFLNADTINIAMTLWNDPDALKQTADNIQTSISQIKDSSGIYSFNSPDGKTVVMSSRIHTGDSTVADPKRNGDSITFRKEDIRRTVLTLKSTGIPIGWAKENRPDCTFLGWVGKIAGLLLTSFALLLGAPFWFDLLNKIVNLRAAGKKEGGTAGDNSPATAPAAQPVQPANVNNAQTGEEAVG